MATKKDTAPATLMIVEKWEHGATYEGTRQQLIEAGICKQGEFPGDPRRGRLVTMRKFANRDVWKVIRMSEDRFEAHLSFANTMQGKQRMPEQELTPAVKQHIYQIGLSMACKERLTEIDQLLTGKVEGAQYRLDGDQYDEARQCLAALWAIVNKPTLRISALGRARADTGFQDFIAGVVKS